MLMCFFLKTEDTILKNFIGFYTGTDVFSDLEDRRKRIRILKKINSFLRKVKSFLKIS